MPIRYLEVSAVVTDATDTTSRDFLNGQTNGSRNTYRAYFRRLQKFLEETEGRTATGREILSNKTVTTIFCVPLVRGLLLAIFYDHVEFITLITASAPWTACSTAAASVASP
jgi:hypothetical protein